MFAYQSSDSKVSWKIKLKWNPHRLLNWRPRQQTASKRKYLLIRGNSLPISSFRKRRPFSRGSKPSKGSLSSALKNQMFRKLQKRQKILRCSKRSSSRWTISNKYCSSWWTNRRRKRSVALTLKRNTRLKLKQLFSKRIFKRKSELQPKAKIVIVRWPVEALNTT